MKKKRKHVAHISLQEVLEKELKDPEFRFYFEREQAISRIAHLIRDARQHAHLTQTELAKRAGTTQSVIARLESGGDARTPSMELLYRIANALKAKLVIMFEYKKAA